MENPIWSVAHAHGTLRSVLMHRPGPELGVVNHTTLQEFHFEAPVDQEAFRGEYDEMVRLLEGDGVDCVFLTDVLATDSDSLDYIAHRPNMTYTRDLAVVFRNGAVLMSPRLPGRRRDQYIIGRALERMGIPILGTIEGPAFLEGGGVTMIGADTIVASICDRANQSGTAALRELVLGSEAECFLEVPLPAGHIHIDGLFMPLDERLAIWHPPTLDGCPCRLYRAGRAEPRHVMFGEFLAERGVALIPIEDDEMRAGHLNVVVTRQGRSAVGFDTAKRLSAELAARGWKLATFPSETLRKGNGGAHCMTCPIHVS